MFSTFSLSLSSRRGTNFEATTVLTLIKRYSDGNSLETLVNLWKNWVVQSKSVGVVILPTDPVPKQEETIWKNKTCHVVLGSTFFLNTKIPFDSQLDIRKVLKNLRRNKGSLKTDEKTNEKLTFFGHNANVFVFML